MMTIEKLIQRIDITRSRLESRLSGNAVINVTSARSDDGAAAFASVLAQSFAQAGHATLLVEGRPASNGDVAFPLGNGDLMKRIRAGKRGAPDTLRLSQVVTRSNPEIVELYASLRAQYAVSITSHSLSEDPGGLGLASLADAVLVSVKSGRAACENDRQLNEALREASASVSGVVLVDSEVTRFVASQHIDSMQFARAHEAKIQASAVGARVG